MDRATTIGGFPPPVDKKPMRLVVALLGAAVLTEALVKRRRRSHGPAPEAYVAPRESIPAPAVAPVPAQPERRASVRLPARATAWRWASVPVAALLVILALNLLQGGDDAPAPAPDATTDARAVPADQGARVIDVTGGAAKDGARASKSAQLVSESTYSLALPAGWDRVSPQGGATFAAAASGGAADASLWIERDPELDFAAFEARSIAQLGQLAGSAEVVDRTTGPAPESTIVRIAAPAPSGAPEYEVVLRAAEGGYWYYLATTVQPDAPASAIAGVETIQGSLVPEGGPR